MSAKSKSLEPGQREGKRARDEGASGGHRRVRRRAPTGPALDLTSFHFDPVAALARGAEVKVPEPMVAPMPNVHRCRLLLPTCDPNHEAPRDRPVGPPKRTVLSLGASFQNMFCSPPSGQAPAGPRSFVRNALLNGMLNPAPDPEGRLTPAAGVRLRPVLADALRRRQPVRVVLRHGLGELLGYVRLFDRFGNLLLAGVSGGLANFDRAESFSGLTTSVMPADPDQLAQLAVAPPSSRLRPVVEGRDADPRAHPLAALCEPVKSLHAIIIQFSQINSVELAKI